jgi:hypothetical protein
MVEMAILGTVVSEQRVMNGTDCGYFSIETYSGGGSRKGNFVPDPSSSSPYLVPDSLSKLFSYLFTTFAPLPLPILCLYSVVWHTLLVIPVPGGAFSAHSSNNCCLTCLEATRGLVEYGRKFWCNVGATEPIRMFVPPPSHNSTPWCVFNIHPSSHNIHSIVLLRYVQLLFVMAHEMDPILFLLHAPPCIPHHPSFPSLFGRVVCLHRMCCIPLIHLFHTHRHVLRPYP